MNLPEGCHPAWGARDSAGYSAVCHIWVSGRILGGCVAVPGRWDPEPLLWDDVDDWSHGRLRRDALAELERDPGRWCKRCIATLRRRSHLTPKQAEALSILLESPRGCATLQEVAFLLPTTLPGAGRILSGLSRLGLAYSDRMGADGERRWWPTKQGD